MGQAMKLHRQPAHAGSSGPVNRAGSPACRGWRLGKVKADRTSEDANSGETNPTKANQGFHNSCCGSAFNRFGASQGAKSKATVRDGLLFAAGSLHRDHTTGPKKLAAAKQGNGKCLGGFLSRQRSDEMERKFLRSG